MTTSERITRYMAFLYNSGGRDGKPASYETIRQVVKPLGALGLAFGNREESEIAREEFEPFYMRLTDEKLKNTRHQYRTLLLAFLRWSGTEREELGLKRLVPLEIWLSRRDSRCEPTMPEPYFGDDEFTRRCMEPEPLKPKYLLLARIMAYAGLRPHEALHLRPRDVRPDGVVIRNSKGGRTQEFAWFSPWLMKEVRKYMEEHHMGLETETYIFRSMYGGRRKPSTGSALNLAFTGRFNPHKLRAWCAATLALCDVKPEILRQRLRHTSLVTTAIYANRFFIDMMNTPMVTQETMERLGVLPQHRIQPYRPGEHFTPEESQAEKAVLGDEAAAIEEEVEA